MECGAEESVWLRLVRGDALEPVRMLSPDRAGDGVSVGTAESCDWRIAAPDMPPVGLQLKVVAGSLFVRAAGPAALRVDGNGVGSIWVPVERGARLAVGGALIEVGLAGRSRHAQCALLQRAYDQPLEPAPDVGLTAPLGEWSARPDAAPDAAIEAPGLRQAPAPRADALARDPACEDAREMHAGGGAVCAAYESEWSATIFGAENPSLSGAEEDEPNGAAYIRGWGSTSLWIAGSLLACAYGCWVLLLEHL